MAIVRLLARRLTELLLIGFLCVALVRYAPGFDVDEREWDGRLGGASIATLRANRAEQTQIVSYYLHYLAGIARGDMGISQTFECPVVDLLAARVPHTLGLIGTGWLMGTASALVLAITMVSVRGRPWRVWGDCLAAALLSIPAGVLGLAALLFGASTTVAMAIYVVPRTYEYAVRLFQRSAQSPALLVARARGLGWRRILLFYWLAPLSPPLAAVLAMTFCAAFGAAIPIEVVSDSPGLGQLAWKAALGRDLPLLLAVTMIAALLTLSANTIADLTLPDRRAV